jgi:hypothetical protein
MKNTPQGKNVEAGKCEEKIEENFKKGKICVIRRM